MSKLLILVAEPNDERRRRWSALLRREGLTVSESSDVRGILYTLRQNRHWDLLVLNASFAATGDGLEVVHLLRRGSYPLPVMVIATESTEDLAVAALKAGVADYLRLPFADADLLESVRRCLSGARQPQSAATQDAGAVASEPPSGLVNTPGLIGESPTMQAIKATIERIATADSHTLITGETGTGKELVAGLLHRRSIRQTKPFVCINCAALPNDLVESELFGYERGAFTGAHTRKEGQLQLAAGGTIFFDEIGDMSLCAQAKVLRAIENKEVQRLGGTSGTPVDIRVVAATNCNLEQLVTDGKFRADLYFRLNVARIHLPPLRNRKEDIPALCAHYIRIMNQRFGRQVEGLTAEAINTLLCYDWPGNVRELKNLIEATFIHLPPQSMRLANLPEQFRRRLVETAALPQNECERLLGALFATNWNVSKAARQLQWSRMTVYRKLAHYQVVRSSEGTNRMAVS